MSYTPLKKNKPKMFRFYFIFLADAKEYFIYSIDVFQRNNMNKIKILW